MGVPKEKGLLEREAHTRQVAQPESTEVRVHIAMTQTRKTSAVLKPKANNNQQRNGSRTQGRNKRRG
ncbi:unnamed protein product [Ectocarpus sp. CCAP 1310/34]|nr:unnamed protein product [Ectocarpus sp. CCAP 1310/34]